MRGQSSKGSINPRRQKVVIFAIALRMLAKANLEFLSFDLAVGPSPLIIGGFSAAQSLEDASVFMSNPDKLP